jgi:hypothetical protein
MNGAPIGVNVGCAGRAEAGRAADVVEDCERAEDGRMQLSASRRMVRTRVQTRSEGGRWSGRAPGDGGRRVVSRRGLPAAVLLGPDSEFARAGRKALGRP